MPNAFFFFLSTLYLPWSIPSGLSSSYAVTCWHLGRTFWPFGYGPFIPLTGPAFPYLVMWWFNPTIGQLAWREQPSGRLLQYYQVGGRNGPLCRPRHSRGIWSFQFLKCIGPNVSFQVSQLHSHPAGALVLTEQPCPDWEFRLLWCSMTLTKAGSSAHSTLQLQETKVSSTSAREALWFLQFAWHHLCLTLSFSSALKKSHQFHGPYDDRFIWNLPTPYALHPQVSFLPLVFHPVQHQGQF